MNVGEVNQMHSKIHHQTRLELGNLLKEADNAGQRETLKQACKQDVEDRATFERDQK